MAKKKRKNKNKDTLILDGLSVLDTDDSFLMTTRKIYLCSLWCLLPMAVFMVLPYVGCGMYFYYFAIAAFGILVISTIVHLIARLKYNDYFFAFLAVFPVFLPAGYLADCYPGEDTIIPLLIYSPGILLAGVAGISFMRRLFFSGFKTDD